MPSFIGSIPTIDDSDMNLVDDIENKKIEISGSKEIVERKIKDIVGNDSLFFFNRGREAIYIALQALGISQDDEVLVQAMTCSAVVSPILWLNAKPVYVDILKDTFNIDVKDLEKKITEKTKVVIVQHTFGRLADMRKIQEICRKNDIKIIEDCAHIFHSDISTTDIGKFSDMSVFSFAQDKSISCVTGGMLVVNNLKYEVKTRELSSIARNQTSEEYRDIKRYLTLWNFAKKYYFTPIFPFTKRVTIGKIAIMLGRWLNITKPQVTERIESCPDIARMSKLQYSLLNNQLQKLDKLNNHRSKILKIYEENLRETLLRYPILVNDSELVLNLLSKDKYICGRWYNRIVFPIKNLKELGYKEGSCPTAEYITKHIINLPLDIDVSEFDAMKIKNIISRFTVC